MAHRHSKPNSLKRTSPRVKHCMKCYYRSEPSTGGTCDYVLKEGHSRGCMPEECIEKGIFHPKGWKPPKKRQIKLTNLKRPSPPLTRPQAADRQQDPQAQLDAFISAAAEHFHITRQEALTRLRKLVQEEQKNG